MSALEGGIINHPAFILFGCIFYNFVSMLESMSGNFSFTISHKVFGEFQDCPERKIYFLGQDDVIWRFLSNFPRKLIS